jgi:hypothetical protein
MDATSNPGHRDQEPAPIFERPRALKLDAYRLAGALTQIASRSKKDKVEIVFDGRSLRVQSGDNDRNAIVVPFVARRFEG